MKPKFTIVIPLHRDTEYFHECLNKCLSLNHKSYEVIVISDKKYKLSKNKKLRYFLTGSKKDTSPAEKRDVALKKARGEILAFIDDDAYPEKGWLKNAEKHFKDENIGGIGGPGLTPPEDSFWKKLGGAYYESFFGSGGIRHRFVKGKAREDYDLPAYNLFIRKRVLEEVKGFSSKYYGGEDTKVCLEIKKKGYKLFYMPDIVVYHHRRAFPIKHLNQLGNVGQQRGLFFKKHPETSKKLFYLLPTIGMLVFMILLIDSFFSKTVAYIFIFLFILGYLVTFVTSLFRNNLLISLLLPFVVLSTHMYYGWRFLKSLMFKK